jgi:chemotaxis protein CheD
VTAMPERAAQPAVYLHPGQIFASSDATMVTTVLGSCVAVCLWDKVSHVAAINHFLLGKNPTRGTNDARYGDTAMERLVAAMWELGSSTDRVVAKVFGGACVLRNFENNSKSIGAQNADAARRFLVARGIEIAVEETGGVRGRKLVFDSSDGSAWVKEL